MLRRWMYVVTDMDRWKDHADVFIDSTVAVFSSERKAIRFVKNVAVPYYNEADKADSLPETVLERRFRIERVSCNRNTLKSFWRACCSGYIFSLYDSEGRKLKDERG